MKKNVKKNLLTSTATFAGLALLLIGCGGGGGGTTGTTGTTSGSTGSTGSTNTTGTTGGTSQLTQAGVSISRVEAVGNRFDTIGEADFKARIVIGGVIQNFSTFDNDDLIFPSWQFQQSFQVGQDSTTFLIYLWDDDSGLSGADDVADIDPKSSSAVLSGTINLKTGIVTGDVTGVVGQTFTVTGNDAKRAKITFQIFGS